MSLDLHSYSLSTESLCAALKRGLLPGPQEAGEAFEKRIQRAAPSYAVQWQETNAILQPLMGFAIDWVPVSKAKRLFFWEGGATWISDEGAATIELKSWGYKPVEVLTHEAVHVLRCMFQEPRFEEHLAYATSPKKWRRLLGPLFRSSRESIVFLLALALGVFEPLWSLPVFVFFGTRLFIERGIFQKCLKKVSLQVASGLTDKEIVLFSKLSIEEIRAYAFQQPCLRWHLLRRLL